jgi:hypothetical protein
MSHPDVSDNKDSTAHDKSVNIFPKVVPAPFNTVHADRVMVAIDRSNGTATLTLLAMHPHPQIGSEGWILSEINWDIVGEIKVPIPTMDTLAIYYLQQISNGLNLLPLIQKHIQEHPPRDPKTLSYGPTDVREERK